ncbi:MAG: TetR/AcrR family transcriptional regulator [Solirubrobacterales bacterium]|nr:TetR/AcrR family transcriptional regulator [Solirubrobacterales bacterium]
MSERGGRANAAKRPKPVKGASAGIAPIYKRLPHGPHRLARGEVIRHQRARIHGAMVEAVAESGYERTSVKQVIGLAGVSRRSFYEQFANKEECFLATFDLIAGREIKRMRKTYIATDGDLEERLLASFSGLTAQAGENRKAATLVLLEARTAGSAGTLRLRRATTTCEQMLAHGFLAAPEASPLPGPIVRGITGGLHGVIAQATSAGRKRLDRGLSEEMVRWTLLFQTPAAAKMDELMAAALNVRMRQISLARAHPRPSAPPGDERTRLLEEILRLAALHEYRELTAPQIADEAGVPIDAFLEVFANRDECFLAALQMISDRLLAIAADPELVSSQWPIAVRRVLGELLSYLGEHPLYARTIAQEAFAAGAEAVEDTLDLMDAIATLLTEGAPAQARSALAVEGIAGALLHTIRCQVASGRVQLLGALSEHLSYLVLVPFIGAEAALEVLAEEMPRRLS